MISTMLRLGLNELVNRRRLTLVMGLVVALPFLGYLLLEAYRTGLVTLYSDLNSAFLVVQSNDSMGEFYGSRLPAQLSAELSGRGASLIVPEIHTVIGATPATAILLRGLPLESYLQVEEFTLLAGRPLQPGEPSRRAMIGVRLAEKLSLAPGGTIDIRGKPFQVVGVFAVGTYSDHEAWISLPDAQALLGWGSDVSTFVIRSGEGLAPGDILPAGASIVQKGSSSVNLLQEWAPFFRLLKTLTYALGFAAIIALTNLLWRLAWQRRRELTIFRSLGFGKSSLVLYLVIQGAAITFLGYSLGALCAVIIGRFIDARTAGISIRAVFNQEVLLTSLALAAILTLAGTALPIWQLTRLNLVELLRDE